jgi:hypothetical protein
LIFKDLQEICLRKKKFKTGLALKCNNPDLTTLQTLCAQFLHRNNDKSELHTVRTAEVDCCALLASQLLLQPKVNGRHGRF